MPQPMVALMSIVALPSLTPVAVPILVPVPVLQRAVAPKNVDWTVTSAPDDLTSPFVPEVQATVRLPLASTLVVWVQLSKVKVVTFPPTVAPVKVPSVLPLTSDLVHVSVVVPNSSLRIADVPDFRDAAISTALFFAVPPTSSVVA